MDCVADDVERTACGELRERLGRVMRFGTEEGAWRILEAFGEDGYVPKVIPADKAAILILGD